MKRTIFIIFSAVLSILIVFCFGEIGFRIFRKTNPLEYITQKNRAYLHEPSATQVNRVPGDGINYTVNINQYGYRGVDFTVPKDQNKLRLFFVGDSFTFGVGAEDDQTISALVEKELNKQGLNIEVINAGAGHTSPITHYMNIRDIHLKYEPDMVVLLFDLTDLRDDWQKERNAIYNDKGEIEHFNATIVNGKRDWWLTCVSYSAFARWMHDKVVRAYKKLQILGLKEYIKIAKEGKRAKGAISILDNVSDENIIVEYDGMLMMRGKERHELINKHWKRTSNYLTKIKALLNDKDIPLFIVMYPYGIYVDKAQWREGRKVWGFKDEKYKDYYPFELMKEYTANQQIPFINTLSYFLQEPTKKYFFDFDGHLTVEGNKVVAQAVVENRDFINFIKVRGKKLLSTQN